MRNPHVVALLAITLTLVPFTAAQETFNSGEAEEDYLGPGDTFQFTFTEVYEDGHFYHCHPHPWMWAMVHVFEEGTLSTHEPGTNTIHVSIVEGNLSDPDTWGYEPQHLTIEVGDTVVWTNNGQLKHSVSYGNPNDEDGHHHGEDDHAHDDHPHDDEINGTPGVGLLGVLASLATVALVRRRG